MLGLNTLAYNEKGDIDRNNVFKFNGAEDNFSLFNLYNKNGELIADELSSMMAAILDDIKDPILETLGINANTIDVWATIVRSGEGTETAINLITQPAIKELSKKLTANTNQVKDIDFKWQNIDNVLSSYESRYKSVYDTLTQESKDLLVDLEEQSRQYNLNDSDMKYWREWATNNETRIIEGNEAHNIDYAKYLLFYS
jgi:SUMO ligase MMS21 Smc5/6 complex component